MGAALQVFDGGEQRREGLLETLDRLVDYRANGIKPRTRRELRRAAQLWDDFDFSRALKTSCINTGFKEISNETFSEFRDWLVSKKFAASTCAKTMDAVRAVLSRLVEKGKVTSSPKARKPRRDKASKRILPPSHIAALYQAAEAMTWPADGWCTPTQAWRVLLALYISLGPRTWDAILMPSAAFKLDPQCPDPDVADEIGFHQHGWLQYIPTKTEQSNRDLTLPLNSVLRRHVEPLLYERKRPELLPFLNRRQDFYQHWKVLLDVAGLSGRPYDPKDLRKTCESGYNRLPGRLGKWITGHAPTGTSETYYDQVIPGMIAVIEDLPLLKSLAPRDRQGRLF